MQLNEIFTIDKYDEAYEFAESNKYIIKEIEKDENGNRQFQIQEVPKPTFNENLEILRLKREEKCFPIINRGVLWYNILTEEQRLELDKWYKEWLDITDTYRTEYEKNPDLDIETIIPIIPSWLK